MKIIDEMADKWLTRFHGNGDAHQFRYYRCDGCRKLVTWNKIKSGGCGCGGSRNIRPAVMSITDKLRCLFMPWSV